MDIEDRDQNISKIIIEEDVNPSSIKRKINEDIEHSVKKQKLHNDNECIQDNNEHVVSSNPRFEWYDEIKRVLSKATDQTLSLAALKKKVIL